MIIHSERLDLLPLTPAFLRAALANNLTAAKRVLGLSFPAGLPDTRGVFARRLEQLDAEPAVQPWLLRAMALREHRTMIGHVGFHAAPDGESLYGLSPGAAEFGYTVFEPFRRQGYAREASSALMDWATRAHGVTRFVLSIRPDNAASLALAAQLGFVRIGSHIDEVDGLEEILERRL